jgi:recombination protein RecA
MPAAAKKVAAPPPKTLSGLRDKMSKRYGDGKVSRRDEVKAYDVISTGSYSVDLATRVGGWVCGRIGEIVGPEGTGKTTLVITSMAQAQKKFPDLAVGIIDMEQSFDFEWAEANGLDTSDKRFLHVFPDDAEDVSDQIKDLVETGLFSMVVVDSIGGMESKQAFDKEAGEQVMGRNAQVITRMVKRLAVLARKHNVAIILVNQYRANVSNPQGMDQPSGPKALRYATSQQLATRRTGETPLKVKEAGDLDPQVVGLQFSVRVNRSKVSAQGKSGTFWLINRETPEHGPIGIDQGHEALTMGLAAGVILQEGGGYYTLPSTKDPKDRLRGRDAVLAHLRLDEPERQKVRELSLAAFASDVQTEWETTFEAEVDEDES